MTFRATSYEAVDEGVYDAELLAIEEGDNDFGPFRKWSFTVTTDEGQRTVTAMTSGASGPKAKAYKWAATLLGRRPGDEEEQLVGRRCRLHLIVNEDGFNRVETVLPPTPAGAESTVNLERLDDQVYGAPQVGF